MFFLEFFQIDAGDGLRSRTQRLVLPLIKNSRGGVVDHKRKHAERQSQHAGIPESQSGANGIKHNDGVQSALECSDLSPLSFVAVFLMFLEFGSSRSKAATSRRTPKVRLQQPVRNSRPAPLHNLE